MIDFLKRFKIILPTEHGSWSLMITPFIIGAGVAAQLPVSLWICAIAALTLFLARQPLALWVRVRRGRARSSDESAALGWSILLLLVAGAAGGALLALGRWPILWVAGGAAAVLALTLALGALLGPRQLVTELLGVIGLALSAPAAYIAATGQMDVKALLVWGIGALHSVISVLFVRLRINQKHDRASHAQALAVILAHAAALAVVVVMAVSGWLPWLVGLPVGLLLLRAVYVGVRNPPLTDIRRFGLTEMAFALGFAALVILAFASGL